MINIQSAITLAASVYLTACTHAAVKPNESHQVSRDYAAEGKIEGIKAYIYGNKTVLELEKCPVYLTVKDMNNNPVNHERLGHYYRLEQRLDTFTVNLNGRSIEFRRIPATLTHVFSAPLNSTKQKTHPLKAISSQDWDKLLSLSLQQQDNIRHIIESARNPNNETVEEIRFIHDLLSVNEDKLSKNKPIVHVTFQRSKTAFKLNKETADILVKNARFAEKINITGYTDSIIAGVNDARIALERAKSARKYLMQQGISEEKINIASFSQGHFIAPNTKQGRAINRRVEIEIHTGMEY